MSMDRRMAACLLGGAAALVAFPSSAAVDPLQEFKKVVAACEHSVNSLPRESSRPLSNGQWAHNINEPSSLSYDVKKTDSLVSPFTAYIKVASVSRTARQGSEEAARTVGTEGRTINRGLDELRYAFQESRWKLVGASSKRESKRPGETDFVDPVGTVELKPESVLSAPWLAGCAPPAGN